jgi:hypothetical protein
VRTPEGATTFPLRYYELVLLVAWRQRIFWQGLVRLANLSVGSGTVGARNVYRSRKRVAEQTCQLMHAGSSVRQSPSRSSRASSFSSPRPVAEAAATNETRQLARRGVFVRNFAGTDRGVRWRLTR